MGRLVGSLIGAFGGRALGGMLGGNTGSMIGSLAGSVLGGRGMGSGGGGGGLGGLLGGLMGGDQQQANHAADQLADSDAEILIRAMCNSAKADGRVDQDEIDRIVTRLGEISPDEDAFLRAELARPLDANSFIASVPSQLANDVYAASLVAIEPDHSSELAYLDQLAAGLDINDDTRQQIHQALGIS